MAATIFAASVFLAVLYLPLTSGDVSWRRSIHKTLPVALLAVAAWVDGATPLLVAALALSAFGDLALSRKGDAAFLAGMGGFALAHLAYIALLAELWTGLSPLGYVLAAALLVLAASTEVWLAPRTGDLRWPVRGYVAIITGMGLMALGLPAGYCIALLGALAFVVSDLVLALELFVLPDPHRMRWLAGKIVWITYIAAQVGLFWGLGALA